jgi:hypothetical protein
MDGRFDIFKRLPDGHPIWIMAVEGIEEARRRLVTNDRSAFSFSRKKWAGTSHPRPGMSHLFPLLLQLGTSFLQTGHQGISCRG